MVLERGVRGPLSGLLNDLLGWFFRYELKEDANTDFARELDSLAFLVFSFHRSS